MWVEGNISLPRPRGGVLLIQLGDIGDVVLTLPAMQALRRRFPDNELAVCVREHARELAEDCPWTDRVIAVDKRAPDVWRNLLSQFRFLSRLRKPGFSLAIDLRTGTRGAIAAFLSGAPYRIGRFSDDGPLWRNRLFTHLVRPTNEIHQYASEHHLNILAPLGLATDEKIPTLVVPESRKRRAGEMLRAAGVPGDRPMVAIHPFSLWSYKEWQTREWTTVIRHLRDHYGFSVIITGAPPERARAMELTEPFEDHVFNLAGNTTIGDLPAVLQLCRLFIGVDTASLHIAAAVGVPTIGLFGPSSPLTWAPRGDRHCVITKGMPCQPCRKKGCHGSEKSRCLDELDAVEVITEMAHHLRRLPLATPLSDTNAQ